MVVQASCYNHTYWIDKAKERLGYKPVPDSEAGIQRAVAWSLTDGGCSKVSESEYPSEEARINCYRLQVRDMIPGNGIEKRRLAVHATA